MAASTVIRSVPRLPPLPTVKDLLHLYRTKALKQLSQNFLLDPSITRRVVKAAGRIKNSHVIEVGPGPGSLTRPILELGANHVVVIEKDTRFKPYLDMLAEASDGRMNTVYGDVLQETMEDLIPRELAKDFEDYPPDIHLIGNLPFSVSTPLIIRWLRMISEKRGPFSFGRVRMTLTFQKEVAERIVAPVMDVQRCRLSVMCQNYCFVEHKLTLPGRVFLPKPDVDVGVVRLTPLTEPIVNVDFKLLERVCTNLFNTRQKYIKNVIDNLFPLPKQHLSKEMLKLAEVSEDTRIVQLTVEDFGRLCHVYDEFCKSDPEIASYNYRMKC